MCFGQKSCKQTFLEEYYATDFLPSLRESGHCHLSKFTTTRAVFHPQIFEKYFSRFCQGLPINRLKFEFFQRVDSRLYEILFREQNLRWIVIVILRYNERCNCYRWPPKRPCRIVLSTSDGIVVRAHGPGEMPVAHGSITGSRSGCFRWLKNPKVFIFLPPCAGCSTAR